MKKFLAVAMALLLLCALTACGSPAASTNPSGATTTVTPSATMPASVGARAYNDWLATDEAARLDYAKTLLPRIKAEGETEEEKAASLVTILELVMSSDKTLTVDAALESLLQFDENKPDSASGSATAGAAPATSAAGSPAASAKTSAQPTE